jgi:hypothetical protein
VPGREVGGIADHKVKMTGRDGSVFPQIALPEKKML